MKEIWKDIPNYESLYMINNVGVVKSKDKTIILSNGNKRFIRSKTMKSYVSKVGYLALRLTKNGNSKLFYVHQLMAMAFLDHSPCKFYKVVDHINNNPLDNRVENLQIVSNRKNTSKDRKGSSKYTGVCWHKERLMWMSSISINGKFKYLGYFPTEKEAHLSYIKQLNKINNDARRSN